MTVTGPDFLSIQVRDLQRSAGFYSSELGLTRLQDTPPGVVAFGRTFVFADPDGYHVAIHGANQ